jgi:iron complex outermembrane receptor protein
VVRSPSASADEQGKDVMELPIEDLLNVKVTSVSKKAEPYFMVPSALTVITQDDIRRSGATSVPELLRLVPGMDVARITSSRWAISSRGFNDEFANKLLVLIDGRTVYTPIFAGVHWDAQDVMLEDIERIEVIRGPGATLWGSNAVNGVVNIITKEAKDSQGAMVTGGGGNEERAFGGVRYGGKLGEQTFYRFFFKYFDRDGSVDPDGHSIGDDWQMAHGGFRLDSNLSERSRVSIHGDIYGGDERERTFVTTLSPPTQLARDGDVHLFGADLIGKYEHSFASGSRASVQAYYDHYDHEEPLVLTEHADTIDLELQHRIPVGTSQDIVWGLDYRHIEANVDNTPSVGFFPDHRATDLYTGFLQGERRFFGDRLRLIIGSKFEHNDRTGVEIQPGAAFSYSFSSRQVLWGALSRAVRTPAQHESDISATRVAPPAPGSPLTVLEVGGDRHNESERLTAYELGYRARLTESLFADLGGFYNVYRDLIVVRAGTPSFSDSPSPGHVVLPLRYANFMRGDSYGIELSSTWSPTSMLRVSGGYSWLVLDLHSEAADQRELAQGSSPHHQFHLNASLELPRSIELNALVYYVDNLAVQQVPSYVRFDANVFWRPRADLELAVVGQNLNRTRHTEFQSATQVRTEIERGVFGKVTWRFDPQELF